MAWTPDRRDLDGGDAETPGPGPRSPEREADPAVARDARYRAWDGTQALPDLDADAVLDAIRDDLLGGGDLEEALARLAERGLPGSDGRPELPGLRELMERLAARRRELLEQGRLDDVLADVRRELAEIIAQERAGIEARAVAADEAPSEALRDLVRRQAQRRRASLDAVPDDVGGRIRGLEEHEFMDQGARQRFEDLVDRLRRQVLDRQVAGLSDALRSMRPEDLAGAREMVRDLNRLLEQRLDGREPDVRDFLARHGDSFPGATSLDDIIEQLGARMAAMDSLLRSLGPDARAELQAAMDALLRDDRLRWDLARMAAALDQLLPGGLGTRYQFRGREPMGLDDALGQLDQLAGLDRLAEQLGTATSPADLDAVDRGTLRQALGPEASSQLDALANMGRRLEEAGYVARRGDRLELTPRGIRQVGTGVLDELFARLRRDAFGGHALERVGRAGDRTELTKPYEFGDPFHLDLRATVTNALRRAENAPEARGDGPVHLAPDDFEVARTEAVTTASTVLLVDLSRSMLLRGCFLAAKKVALALHSLISTRFPRDRLAVVGFAYRAREIDTQELASLQLDGYEYGTNLQHGLQVARRILAGTGSANREIIVVTDGEPTAHLEGAEVEFSYPPTRRTLEATLREVDRCTRAGIVINTFMLERNRALVDFIHEVSRRNGGRAFHAEPEHLGEYVLVDFVRRHTKRVSSSRRHA